MSRVLTQSQLQDAVLSLVEKRQPISARRLAREAFVAPATLYGQVSSIEEAIDIGRAAVGIDAAPRLAAAVRHGHFTELAFWASRNFARAGLFFNPTQLGGLDCLDCDLKQARAVVGGVLAYGFVDSPQELRRRLIDALDHLARIESEPYTTAELPVQLDKLAEDVWSEARRLIAESNDRVAIRTAAVDLLRDDSPDGWTFRRVAEITGEPLAAIHRHGPRSRQLSRAVGDFAAGLQTVGRGWARDNLETITMSFEIMKHAPGILGAFAEVTSDRLRTGAAPLVVSGNAVSSAVHAHIGLSLLENASRPWVSATR